MGHREFGTSSPILSSYAGILMPNDAETNHETASPSESHDAQPCEADDEFALERFRREALFAEFVTPETVKSFADRGILQQLLSFEIPALRLGVDELRFPCTLVAPTLADIAAIADPEARALAILENRIYGVGERERSLILSVRESVPFGWAAQANLVAPQKQRKVYPWWYRPFRQPKSRNECSNLFKDFRVDLSGEAADMRGEGAPDLSSEGAETEDKAG